MEEQKIKRHFSLFMVKKSIKKTSKQPKKNEMVLEEDNSRKTIITSTIPKYIELYNLFHMKGDIFFVDKLYDDDIGLVSPRNSYRAIGHLNFYEFYDLWTTEFISANYDFDSWQVIYERLMTLGDEKAYDLAQTIKSSFLSHIFSEQSAKKPLTYVLPIEASPNFEHYSNEIDQLLTEKRGSYYLFLQYEVSNSEKGLMLKKMAFSKEFVKLIWGDETFFVDLQINEGVFDFLTVEKERYFEFVKNNILVQVSTTAAMNIKLRTYDGVFTHLYPAGTKKVCFDKNGNLLGLLYLYEFPIKEDFLIRVSKAREKKTYTRMRKSMREENLETALKLYYTHEEVEKKNSVLQIKMKYPENVCQIDIKPDQRKRCGYKLIINH